jgi:hypothetical protein
MVVGVHRFGKMPEDGFLHAQRKILLDIFIEFP